MSAALRGTSTTYGSGKLRSSGSTGAVGHAETGASRIVDVDPVLRMRFR